MKGERSVGKESKEVVEHRRGDRKKEYEREDEWKRGREKRSKKEKTEEEKERATGEAEGGEKEGREENGERGEGGTVKVAEGLRAGR